MKTRLPRRQGGRVGSVVLLGVLALAILRPSPSELLGLSEDEEAATIVTAQVLRVVDGDTIEVRVHKQVEDVRLIGIDTPETKKPGVPIQCFGPQASNLTHELLDGKTVRLVLGVERRDRYGRLLAYVRLKGRLINAILVRRGFARSLSIAPNDRFASLFEGLELDAARAGRGLWGACGP